MSSVLVRYPASASPAMGGVQGDAPVVTIRRPAVTTSPSTLIERSLLTVARPSRNVMFEYAGSTFQYLSCRSAETSASFCAITLEKSGA